jgi:GR25 family glycosyltransferase involved in LPS biosynthesis
MGFAVVLPVFYINLARRIDRRRFMEEQFARLGVSAERVEAVTTEQVPESAVTACCNPRKGRWVTKSELACSLSHRSIWQLMADRAIPAACILEDDARLSPQFTQALDAASGLLSKLDLIKIERRNIPVAIGGKLAELTSEIALHRLYTFNYGSCGYLISLKGAGMLLAKSVRYDVPLDNILFNPAEAAFHKLAIGQTVPALAFALRPEQDGGTASQSDILEDWRGRTQAAPAQPHGRQSQKRIAALLQQSERDNARVTFICFAE